MSVRKKKSQKFNKNFKIRQRFLGQQPHLHFKVQQLAQFLISIKTHILIFFCL